MTTRTATTSMTTSTSTETMSPRSICTTDDGLRCHFHQLLLHISSKNLDDNSADEHDNFDDDEDIQGILTEPPSKFICPLTLEVMKNPVISMDGKNFERDAIVAWLSNGHDTCPLTRKPLDMWDLQQNKGLRKEIRQWEKVGEAYRLLTIRDRIMIRHASKLLVDHDAIYDQ